MLKMQIPVTVLSVKAAKDEKSNNYVDLLFTGGSISIAVDSAIFTIIKPLEGCEVFATFLMKPQAIVKFGRPVSVFEAIKIIDVKK